MLRIHRVCCLALFLAGLLLPLIWGCGDSSTTPPDQLDNITPNDPPATIILTSTAFSDGGTIPAKYAYTGSNLSPPLAWANLPETTQEVAIIMQDLNANNLAHWVIYKINITITSLPEGIFPAKTTPENAYQGINDFLTLGYYGPNPPSGLAHHYQFTIYALNEPLLVSSELKASQLQSAMQGHILAVGRLTGTFRVN